MKIIAGIYVILNVITFIMYGIDKQKAKRNKWRIPEHTLLLLAAIGGSYGAFLGMYVFHHKTRHTSFMVRVPLYIITNTIFLAAVWYFL